MATLRCPYPSSPGFTRTFGYEGKISTMPYPSQIDLDSIVATASAMIEQDGVEALSLGKLAEALGVRAPSLYRYFKNKAALLQAVNLRTLEELFAALNEARTQHASGPYEQLVAVAHAFRLFAHGHPRRYVLAMTAEVAVTRPDEDLLVEMILPIQAIVAELAGEAVSLSALRGYLALTHGFAMLEVHGQLQRGGNLTAAFDDSLRAYLTGWQAGRGRVA